MFGRSVSRYIGFASAGLVAMAVVACDGPAEPAAPSHDRAALSRGSAATVASLNQDLAALRRATARFHVIEEARRAGHTILVTHPQTGAECLEHPTLGGMGFHFLDPELADDVVSAASPEVLIYEPGSSGKLRLVAVEFLVPFAIRGEDQPPPTLFGREFKKSETFQVWALHAWAWKHNPSGIFTDWNPNVTCEGA